MPPSSDNDSGRPHSSEGSGTAVGRPLNADTKPIVPSLLAKVALDCDEPRLHVPVSGVTRQGVNGSPSRVPAKILRHSSNEANEYDKTFAVDCGT